MSITLYWHCHKHLSHLVSAFPATDPVTGRADGLPRLTADLVVTSLVQPCGDGLPVRRIHVHDDHVGGGTQAAGHPCQQVAYDQQASCLAGVLYGLAQGLISSLHHALGG